MSQPAPPLQAMPFVRRLEWSLHPGDDEAQGRGGPPPEPEPGNVPRVARLMALAIHFDSLLLRGEAPDYATLARLGQVTRARMSQIMDVLCLAPDIQEALLFLPRTQKGRDPITERDLRPIAAESDWGLKREAWGRLRQRRGVVGAAGAAAGAAWVRADGDDGGGAAADDRGVRCGSCRRRGGTAEPLTPGGSLPVVGALP